MNSRAFALVCVLAFASGCLASGGNQTTGSGSPTMSMPPPPKVLYSHEVGGCPATPPANTMPIVEKLTVPDGYDTVLIVFHVTGQGNFSASLRAVNGNALFWQNTPTQFTDPANTCGSHASHGTPISKPIESGDYNLRLSYYGDISALIEITVRSSKSNDTSMPMHNHTMAPTP